MSVEIKKDQWVYVVVQNPGGAEKIVGQYDEGLNLTYIPVFMDKDEAQMAFGRLAFEKGSKYEVQAILYEDAASHAADNQCLIFILDSDGKILDKIQS